jgi:hypothetical protein
MKYRFAAFAATLLLSSALIPKAALAQNELNHGSSSDIHPDGRGNPTREKPARNPKGESGGAVVTGNGISYHGGPVMQGVVNVYYIWYGDWTKDSGASPILTDWAHYIGDSPYEKINTTYGDTTGNVSGSITYAGSISIPSTTFGTVLSDSSIASIVSYAFSSGLTRDTNGVYFVLTAPYISETSGFLSKYCGWHTWGTFGGMNIKYAFVGNAAASLGSCAWQTTQSPNGDPAADAMVSVMAHELEEAASDPNLNAWYDTTGAENADKCAWTFGATHSASGGGIANMTLGNRDYLIQQNWVNAGGGYCALSYSASTTPDFSLSVSPASQTLPSAGGTTGNYTIIATPTGGFAGTVTYAIAGLPGFATASAVTPGNTFTITAVNPVPGTYNFTITGSSANPVLSHNISASLVISQPPQPTFTISISPSSQSVNRGQSVNYTVTVTAQNGFTGTVDLSASGAKTGLGLTLTPGSVGLTASITSGISALNATASNSARKGNNTLTVTGSSGSIVTSASASLHIN